MIIAHLIVIIIVIIIFLIFILQNVFYCYHQLFILILTSISMQLCPFWKLTWFFYSHFVHKMLWRLFSACNFVKTLLWLNLNFNFNFLDCEYNILLTEISCLHGYGKNSLCFFAGSAVPQDYFWLPLLQLVIRLPFYMKGKRVEWKSTFWY